MKRRVFSSLVLPALLCAPVSAATVAPPAHLGELARMSRSVVLARALGSAPDDAPTGIPRTATRFALLRQVGGERLPEGFLVSELGGVRGGRGFAVGGSPRYEVGRTYLLFLARAADGRLSARMMAYGLLVEDEGAALLVPVEEASEVDVLAGAAFEPVTAYDKGQLLAHLEDVMRGAAWSRERAGSITWDPLVPPPAGCVFMTSSSDGLPVRWFGYEAGAGTSQIRHTTPGQAGISDGGVSAVTQGVAAWTNHPDSIIRFTYAGSAPAAINCTDGVEANGAWFNDPCGDIADLSGCAGTLAVGGLFFSTGTVLHDGERWHPASGTFVVVNNGTQCIGEVSFHEMMTHEVGHSQGFGHHAAAPPPNNPTMSSQLKADGRGAALVGLDKTCASHAYHTFLDVPFESGVWRFIEAVENAGVTAGCAPGVYCGGSGVSREEMAVFLLVSREGPGYQPPACVTPPFNDVPVSSPYCRWIRELAARGVTGGCSGGNYCPTLPVSREQMAVFLLRTRENPTYFPPPCVTPLFADVPCTSGFAPWINELVARGITAGCGSGLYCPADPNTRGQMAVFLTTTFGLALPN